MKNLNEPAIIVGYRFLIAMCLWIWAGVGTLCAQKQIQIVLRERYTRFQM